MPNELRSTWIVVFVLCIHRWSLSIKYIVFLCFHINHNIILESPVQYYTKVIASICLQEIYLTGVSLFIVEDNARIITEQKGVVDVINAIQIHMQYPELTEAAAAVLLSLTIEGNTSETKPG